MDQEPSQYASQVLAQLSKGELMIDVGESLIDCVRATRERRKASKLVITIDVSPGAVGDDSVVTLKGDVKTAMPPVARGVTLFFSDDDYALHREPPNQGSFFSGPVSVAIATGRTSESVDTETGEIRASS